jgi:hypothetical protein
MGKLSYTGTLIKDLLGFAKQNKAYWIIPMIVVLGITALLVVASQVVAPFIYTLF